MAYLTGFHAIEEALKRPDAKGVVLVAGSGPRIKRILEEAAKRSGVRVERVEAAKLAALAPDARGVAYESAGGGVEPPSLDLDDFLADFDKDSGTVLVLDHLSDPHNFGSILRSADALGVDLVVVPSRRAAKETDAVARVSSGALAWVPVAVVTNLARAIGTLKDAGFWAYAADMDGEELWSAELPAKLAIVMGAEGSGVSRLVRGTCDAALRIPMPASAHVDSLNVGVAAGIFLYEVARRRRAGN